MKSDESEGISDLPVTFALNLPNDLNTEEVISLIEVLQSDIESLMRCFWMQLFMRQKMKQSKLKAKQRLHWKQRNKFNTIPCLPDKCSNEQPPGPSDNFPESSGWSFKTLAEQDLQEIECNKYRNFNKKTYIMWVLVFLTVSSIQYWSSWFLA